jgi:hypothetical protein
MDVDGCEEYFKDIFGNSVDLVCEKFDTTHRSAMLAYFDGLVNKDLIDRDIIRPLKDSSFNGDVFTSIKTIYRKAEDISTVAEFISDGFVVLIYGDSNCIIW